MAWQYAALGAFQLWSGLQQADILQRSAGLNAKMSEINAQYAELDALKAEQQGLAEEARYEGDVEAAMADLRVQFAAAGIDQSFGTAAQLTADTEVNAFLNRLDIREAAYARARGFRREARNIRLQGSMAQFQGEMTAGATRSAALMNAAATALSGYKRSPSPSSTPVDFELVGSEASSGGLSSRGSTGYTLRPF